MKKAGKPKLLITIRESGDNMMYFDDFTFRGEFWTGTSSQWKLDHGTLCWKHADQGDGDWHIPQADDVDQRRYANLIQEALVRKAFEEEVMKDE